MKTLFIALLTIILLNACLNGETNKAEDKPASNDSNIIIHNIFPYKKEFYDESLSPLYFIKDIKVIKTKTSPNPNSIVAEAKKIFLLNGNFFIWDKKFSGLKVFDAEGNFLFQVGKIGKGPGEYIRINDVQVVDSSQIILLCDNVRLQYFDLMGNYIKGTRLDFFASKFVVVDSENYLFYINNNFSEKSKNFNAILTDSAAKVLKRFFESSSEEGRISFDYTGFLLKGVHNPLFSIPYDDKIWAYNKGSFKVAFKFDLGINKLADEIINNNVQSKGKEQWEADYLFNDLFETQKYLFFSFQDTYTINYGIFNKQTNSFNRTFYMQDTDDYLGKFFSVPLGGLGDTIVIGLPPERIIYLKDKMKDYVKSLKNKNKPLYELITSYQSSDNLVLLKCVLK